MKRLTLLFVNVVTLSVCLPAFCLDAAMFRAAPQPSGVYGAAGLAKDNQVEWKFEWTAS